MRGSHDLGPCVDSHKTGQATTPLRRYLTEEFAVVVASMAGPEGSSKDDEGDEDERQKHGGCGEPPMPTRAQHRWPRHRRPSRRQSPPPSFYALEAGTTS